MSKAKNPAVKADIDPEADAGPDLVELGMDEVFGSTFAPEPGQVRSQPMPPIRSQPPISADDRIANLERLQLAAEARKVTGHRKAHEIQADIARGKERLNTMILERDQLMGREIREAKIFRGQRELAMEAWKRAGVPWDEAEWRAGVKPPYKMPLQAADDLHRQHYVVAKLEDELEALRQAVGAASYA